MTAILAWLAANGPTAIIVMLGVDQALSAIPGIQSNSVFQLIGKALSWLHDVFVKAPPAPPAA